MNPAFKTMAEALINAQQRPSETELSLYKKIEELGWTRKAGAPPIRPGYYLEDGFVALAILSSDEVGRSLTDAEYGQFRGVINTARNNIHNLVAVRPGIKKLCDEIRENIPADAWKIKESLT